MKTILKRSGRSESFEMKKIIDSMRGAGISQDTAWLVAADIKHHDGITTSEVRNCVIGAIKDRDPQAMQKYKSHPKDVDKVG